MTFTSKRDAALRFKREYTGVDVDLAKLETELPASLDIRFTEPSDCAPSSVVCTVERNPAFRRAVEQPPDGEAWYVRWVREGELDVSNKRINPTAQAPYHAESA